MAIVFDIQHFSIHNGPGIRTAVFFKGCPLRCQWCHNPESLSVHQDRIFRSERCIHCNGCLEVCPRLEEGQLPLDVSCGNCQLCMEVCPTNALEIYGTHMETDEILEVVLKDKVFYESSSGGVTLSGGEPLLQSKSLIALTHALKAEGVHVTLDTSGYGDWQTFEAIRDAVDLYLYDLKHLDEEAHREGTGVGTQMIKSNYIQLQQLNARLWVRIPMIPGNNMDSGHIRQLIDFLSQYPPEQINLLPYHRTASRKYELLAIEMADYQKTNDYDLQLQGIKEAMTQAGLNCQIGG